jgi:hypothetical protein
VPTLKRNDIVVMDNCRAQSRFGRRSKPRRNPFSESPSYSPDLNPIETPFSKFKSYLCTVAARLADVSQTVRRVMPMPLSLSTDAISLVLLTSLPLCRSQSSID